MSGGGLSITELAAACAELEPRVTGAHILGCARRGHGDDLLLFLETEVGRLRLLLAPGGRRGRLGPTERRFGKADFASGPLVDRLEDRLRGATLRAVRAHPDERRASLDLENDGTRLELVLELFGNRGLWALCTEDGTILELSRLPGGRRSDLVPGAPYHCPPPRPAPEGEHPAPPRFAPPLLEAIDAHFSAADREREAGTERDELSRRLQKESQRRRTRCEGVRQRVQAMRDTAAIRQEADLLLAYGHGVPRGQTELRVPDPEHPDQELVLRLRPELGVQRQAETLYAKARKYEKGRARSEAELAQLEKDLNALQQLLEEAPELAIEELRNRCEALGLRPAHRRERTPTKPNQTAKEQARQAKIAKICRGENLRHARTQEGHLVLIGRNNAQNDRLSIRIARGNDLWFHVGGGRAGSHVVLRLERGRNASLDSLLDAATLAVHFSKARGEPLCEVIYTQAKNVRKPKGLPPGKVLATHTKELRVRSDAERMQRLLKGGGDA